MAPGMPSCMPGTRPLAVITGASSGIGLELAKIFAANDFDLIVNAEDAALDAVREGIAAAGVSVEAVQADLTRPDGVEELAARALAGARPVDALVLNAGVGQG